MKILTNKQAWWRAVGWTTLFNSFLPLVGLVIGIVLGLRLIKRDLLVAGVYIIVMSIFIFFMIFFTGMLIGTLIGYEHSTFTLSLVMYPVVILFQVIGALIVNNFVKNGA